MCSEIGHTVPHNTLFSNKEMLFREIFCNNVFRKDHKRIQDIVISLLVAVGCRVPFSFPPSHSPAILCSVIRHQFFDSSYVGISVLPTYHNEFTTVTNARHWLETVKKRACVCVHSCVCAFNQQYPEKKFFF
jgi:hypothetical protein